jgi:hypothetical protein
MCHVITVPNSYYYLESGKRTNFIAGFVPKADTIDPEMFKNKKIPGFGSQDSK